MTPAPTKSGDIFDGMEQVLHELRSERSQATDLPAALEAQRTALLKARAAVDDQLEGLERAWHELAAAGIVPAHSAPAARRRQSRAGQRQVVAQRHVQAV